MGRLALAMQHDDDALIDAVVDEALAWPETDSAHCARKAELLYAAIDARFDRMMGGAALEEVRALMRLGLDAGLPAMRAHGVRELAAHLSGALSQEEAVAKAKTESRRYAKRQMTWLRRFMADWDWFPDADSAVAAASTGVVTAVGLVPVVGVSVADVMRWPPFRGALADRAGDR